MVLLGVIIFIIGCFIAARLLDEPIEKPEPLPLASVGMWEQRQIEPLKTIILTVPSSVRTEAELESFVEAELASDERDREWDRWVEEESRRRLQRWEKAGQARVQNASAEEYEDPDKDDSEYDDGQDDPDCDYDWQDHATENAKRVASRMSAVRRLNEEAEELRDVAEMREHYRQEAKEREQKEKQERQEKLSTLASKWGTDVKPLK